MLYNYITYFPSSHEKQLNASFLWPKNGVVDQIQNGGGVKQSKSINQTSFMQA